MLGMFHRALWAGDVTKPALFERFAQQSCLSVVVDDVVVNKGLESKTYAQLGRAIFDRTSRAVNGKIRHPYSSAIFTANTTVNDEDKAFQSRMILIKFDALRMSGEEDSELYNDWLMIRELISALAVDFESLLWNGKLDRQAIQDCAKYLQQAVGRQRDRNVNLWGLLLYYMLNLNFMFQSDSEDQEKVFEWMIHSVTRAAYEQTNHASVLDQFVLQVAKIRADKGTLGICGPLGAMNSTIYWDKMRTDQNPNPLYNIPYVALRIEPCIAVIKNVLGTHFQHQHIMDAIDKCGWASQGYSYFYDTGNNPWPIQKQEFDFDTNTNSTVPLKQNELTPAMVKRMRCVFFKQVEWDRIVDSCERGGRVEVNFKSILVESSNSDIGKYNLYSLACGLETNGWFGYRALSECTFSKFCGALNALHIGSSTTELEIFHEVAEATTLAGFKSVEHCFQPATLLEFFGYQMPELDAMPPCFKEIPFNSRNDINDSAQDDPLLFFPGRRGDTHDERDIFDDEVELSPPGAAWPPTGTSSPAYSPHRRNSNRGDDEQTYGEGDSPPNGGTPGSNPLGNISNGRSALSESPSDRPVKRRRGEQVEEMDDDNQVCPTCQVCPSPTHPLSQVRAIVPLLYFAKQ